VQVIDLIQQSGAGKRYWATIFKELQGVRSVMLRIEVDRLVYLQRKAPNASGVRSSGDPFDERAVRGCSHRQNCALAPGFGPAKTRDTP
jgi:hypothetical protein